MPRKRTRPDPASAPHVVEGDDDVRDDGLDVTTPSSWPAVLEADEVATILRLSKRKINQLARAQRIPGAFRRGRFWKFRTEALRRWLASERS